MPDSRFFRAHTAAARCAAGEFRLLDRVLVPLSLAHYALLTEILGEGALFEPEIPLADLEIISLVCSQRKPPAHLPSGDDATRASIALLQWGDAFEQRQVWLEYLDACYMSRPRLMSREGSYKLLRAPIPLVIAAFILRHAHGIARDELWHDWPMSEALWFKAAIEEQIAEHTHLCETDEPEPTPTGEELSASLTLERLAAKIFAQADSQHQAAAAKLAKEVFPDSAAQTAAERAAHAPIEAEVTRLLVLAQEGRLSEDLTEITPIAPIPPTEAP